MELVSTMEINGEEREIADAVARGQIATNAQNIATNAEGIANLNNNLSQLEYSDIAGGKNLFDKSKVTIGSAIGSSGIPYIAPTFGYSDYIEISSNATYTYSNHGWYNFYDSNKSHISQDAKKTIISPSNAKYVVISFLLSNIDKLQLEEGDAATDYEPYIPSVKMLADEVNQQKSDLDKYKPKEYYGKSLTMPTDGSYLVTASAMGYSVMVCTYAVYVLDGAIRYIEQVASKDLTLSFSGNVITPSYTANNIYFYVLQIGNIWS